MVSTQAQLDYQKQYRKLNKQLILKRATLKRRARLKEAIDLLGNKCNVCKNTFDAVCYDFHHVNPELKLFNISDNLESNKERFFNEVKKCILLCANCHRLVHKQENTFGKRKV